MTSITACFDYFSLTWEIKLRHTNVFVCCPMLVLIILRRIISQGRNGSKEINKILQLQYLHHPPSTSARPSTLFPIACLLRSLKLMGLTRMPLILRSPICLVVAKEFDLKTFSLSGNQSQLVYLKDLCLDPSYSIFLSIT